MVMIRVVQESATGDACPLCGVTLGQARGATRRQIILSPRPGLFCWRCPDCRGVWAVHAVRQAPSEDAATSGPRRRAAATDRQGALLAPGGGPDPRRHPPART